MTRDSVFISYSHRDKRWLNYIRPHFHHLERTHAFSIWDDTKIKPGSDWRGEIRDALSAAKIAVLLVSPDFIASDFINDEELPFLLNAAEQEGAKVFPLILRPCMFHQTSLSKYQTVNDPARPLVKMNSGERDEIFVGLAQEIHDVFKEPVSPQPSNKGKATIDKLELSITRVCVFLALYRLAPQSQGYTITEICKHTQSKSRKGVVRFLYELEQQGIAEKLNGNSQVYWRLSSYGREVSTRFKEVISGNFR